MEQVVLFVFMLTINTCLSNALMLYIFLVTVIVLKISVMITKQKDIYWNKSFILQTVN